MKVSTSVTVDTVVITYPQKLLTLARRLIDENREFGIAVLVAHVACEVATERTLSEAFGAKGLSYLEDSITRFFGGYNLANDRISKVLYGIDWRPNRTSPLLGKVHGICQAKKCHRPFSGRRDGSRG